MLNPFIPPELPPRYDPEKAALIERLRAFIEWCDDPSGPRPDGVTLESIDELQPEEI